MQCTQPLDHLIPTERLLLVCLCNGEMGLLQVGEQEDPRGLDGAQKMPDAAPGTGAREQGNT